MQSDDEARAIAARLTKAQRRMLLASEMLNLDAYDLLPAGALFRRGLVEPAPTQEARRVHLTALGVRVRAALVEMEAGR
jgi:hypothetical protein